jgi:hypothetical protein
VFFGFREDFIGVLPDDHRIASGHHVVALEDLRHVTPPQERTTAEAITYQG